MRKYLAAIGGTLLGSLLLVASVAAVDPTTAPSPAASPSTGTVAAVLGLTQAQIHELRGDGLSIAQIAQRQQVEVKAVIDALVARWQERIAARVANGALTADQAAALKAQLQTKASTMVNSTTPGGMQGAAVGAGPRNAAGNGSGIRARDGSGTGIGAGPRGTGDGTCDGTGPRGAGRP